ncbi:MAG: helix-turn-helix transcriptional regulator, partial [Chloroflexota bacterium]|nr:helix-turn-helix transcriptional regulator [Chloroflexota bacterium]
DDAALATANGSQLRALSTVANTLGRPDAAKRIDEEARHVLRAGEDWYAAAFDALRFLDSTVLPYHADDLAFREAMASTAEEGWARAQALHLVAPFPVRAVRFPLDFIAGDWDAAQTYAPMLVEPLRGALAHMPTVTLGTIARLQGRREEAWRFVRARLPEGAQTEPGTTTFSESMLFLRLGGLLALDAGDLEGAREWAEASDRWLAWSGAVLGQSEGQMLWAHFHRQAGNREQAYEHAERALAHATEPRQPLALIAAHRLVGELDTDARRFPNADTHLAASLALADACEAPYERALTLLAMAALRAARGEADAVRTLLGEVRAICIPLGAMPTLARVDALLAHLAATPTVAPTYPAGLSAREAEVLRLVATGLTNAQIAERLFLSAHTINAHLTTIYGKLAVPSRAAAVRFALEHDLG